MLRFLRRTHGDPVPEAGVVDAFRADPTSVVLRPVVRAMTSEVALWQLDLKSVRDTAQVREVMAALKGQPGEDDTLRATLAAIRDAVATAQHDGTRTAPLCVRLPVGMVADGGCDDLLDLLEPDSCVRFDVRAVQRDHAAARAAATRLAERRLRLSLVGLVGDPEEEETIRSFAPAGLVFDILTPLDYRERMSTVLRWRAAPAPHIPNVIVSGVRSSVDTWAAASCGATHLSGPFFEDVPVLPGDAVPAPPPADDEVSVFDMAAARHPSQTASLGELIELIRSDFAGWRGEASRSDVLFVFDWPPLPAPAVALFAEMAEAGTAITTLASRLDEPPVPGAVWGRLATDDPLACGWSVTVMTPTRSRVLAALPIGDRGERLARRYAYVAADDRELAQRVARRVGAHLS